MALHISISAEPLFHLGPLAVTNSIFTSWIVSGLLILFAVWFGTKLKTVRYSDKPGKLQSLVEMIIQGLYDLVNGIAGSYHKTQIFFPFIATYFLFIMFSNWSGLLPGVGTVGFTETAEAVEQAETVRQPETPSETANSTANEVTETEDHQPKAASTDDEDVAVNQESVGLSEAENREITETIPEAGELDSKTHETPESGEHSTFIPYFRAPTADINTTLALAIFSVITIQVIGVKFLHLGYFKKFLNLSDPILFAVGILEFFSELSKIISFAFRLFGNIFAGEVLLSVIAFLVPVFVPIPFYGLEVFVGVIQALVFSLLSLVFINIATMGHGEESH